MHEYIYVYTYIHAYTHYLKATHTHPLDGHPLRGRGDTLGSHGPGTNGPPWALMDQALMGPRGPHGPGHKRLTKAPNMGLIYNPSM